MRADYRDLPRANRNERGLPLANTLESDRMLRWLDTTDLDRFVDEVVRDLVERIPPRGVGIEPSMAAPRAAKNPKKQESRAAKAHQSLLDRIERYARENSLNFYKKAHLGNRIKWALKEAGYEPEFVDALTQEAVTAATLAGRGK